MSDYSTIARRATVVTLLLAQADATDVAVHGREFTDGRTEAWIEFRWLDSDLEFALGPVEASDMEGIGRELDELGQRLDSGDLTRDQIQTWAAEFDADEEDAVHTIWAMLNEVESMRPWTPVARRISTVARLLNAETSITQCTFELLPHPDGGHDVDVAFRWHGATKKFYVGRYAGGAAELRDEWARLHPMLVSHAITEEQHDAWFMESVAQRTLPFLQEAYELVSRRATGGMVQ